MGGTVGGRKLMQVNSASSLRACNAMPGTARAHDAIILRAYWYRRSLRSDLPTRVLCGVRYRTVLATYAGPVVQGAIGLRLLLRVLAAEERLQAARAGEGDEGPEWDWSGHARYRLRVCYALSGTGIALHWILLAYAHAMQYVVLTSRGMDIRTRCGVWGTEEAYGAGRRLGGWYGGGERGVGHH
eukprot:3282773-Rhodomonas_salina.1